MKGKTENKIPHLRICVTEKCGHSCMYCRPGGEACRAVNEKEMTLLQIHRLVSLIANCGVSDLKITGGEPLLRDDLPKMVKSLFEIKGIRDIQIVTRSPKAGQMASQLKEVGLSCLNFSLDTLNPFTFFKITKNGRLDYLLQAIDVVHHGGLKLKFNMVVMKGLNDHEIPAMIDFAGKYGATLKLLDLMDMPQIPQFLKMHYVSMDKIIGQLGDKAVNTETIVPPGGIGTPMPKFVMPNGAVVMVKDARVGTWYGNVCIECQNFPCQDAIMALRLTADGCLQRCLLRQDNLINLLAMTENMEPQENIEHEIEKVLLTYREAVYHEAAWKP